MFAVKVVENKHAYFAERLYHSMKVVTLVTGRWNALVYVLLYYVKFALNCSSRLFFIIGVAVHPLVYPLQSFCSII